MIERDDILNADQNQGGENQDNNTQQEEVRSMLNGGSGSEPTYLGFGNNFTNLNSITNITGATAQINDQLAKSNSPFKVIPFDKPNNEKFGYIAVAVAVNDSVFYAPYIVAESGPGPMTVSRFIDATRDRMGQPYTLDAMLDETTIDSVQAELSSIFKVDPNNVYECAAGVIDKLDENLFNTVNEAIQHIEVAVHLTSNYDLNIFDATKKTHELIISYKHIPEGVVPLNGGGVTKADFELTLTSVAKRQATTTLSRSFNKEEGNRDLLTVYGYIDFKIDRETVGVGLGAQQRTVLVPEIIITNVMSQIKSFNFAMLGILTGQIMKNEGMFYNHLLNVKEEVANLNLVANINNVESPTAIPVAKLSDEEIIKKFSEMIIFEPIFSIDVELNGGNENLNQIIQGYKEGWKDVNDSIALLVNNNIEIQPNTNPFSQISIMPKIEYHNQITRDGRDLTLANILARTKNPDVAYTFNNLMLSQDVFNTVVESFDDVYQNEAHVKVTYLRCIVDPQYIDAVITSSGLDTIIRYDQYDIPGSRANQYISTANLRSKQVNNLGHNGLSTKGVGYRSLFN